MTDEYNRAIHYLRISLTDRCNLRCRYCMPAEGVRLLPRAQILQGEEILRLARIFAGLGVDRLRLTGGEPLLRGDILPIVQGLRDIDGIRFLGLTTNGILLEEKLSALAGAGLDGVNISLDTLDPDRYALLTRQSTRDGCLAKVLSSIDATLTRPGLVVKLNCVLAPGGSMEDWLALAHMAKDRPLHVRFIEWMPLSNPAEAGQALPAGSATTPPRGTELLAALTERFGALSPLPQGDGGPAERWQAAGWQGTLGIIHPMSQCFCQDCNRLRLTATGDLKLCLFYDEGVALKPLLRNGARDEDIKAAILQAVARKPRQHGGKPAALDDSQSVHGLIARPEGMNQIGG